MLSYFKGAADCFAGFKLITNPGLRRYVIGPLLINIALFGTVIYFVSEKVHTWITHLLPHWLSFLEFILLPLFEIMILIVVFYTFTMVANLIAAPFNSLLAASVEKKLSDGSTETVSAEAFWKIMIRSVSAELKKIIYQVKWFIPLIIITLIPAVNIVAPFAWFVFTAWFYALEYTDYPLGNHEQLFPEVRDFNHSNKLRVLGFGSIVFIMTSIPFINFLAMPVAVCGATRLTVKVKQQNKEQNHD